MGKEIALRIQFSKSTGYFTALMAIRWELENPSTENKYYTIPFVLTCAAALECALREVLVNVVETRFDDPRKSIREAFLSMSLRGKLHAAIPLSTGFMYRLNESHPTAVILNELISLRNKMTHNEALFQSIKGILEDDENHGPVLTIPEEHEFVIDDPTLGIKRDIRVFHDALLAFDELYLSVCGQADFEGNELVIPVTPDD